MVCCKHESWPWNKGQGKSDSSFKVCCGPSYCCQWSGCNETWHNCFLYICIILYFNDTWQDHCWCKGQDQNKLFVAVEVPIKRGINIPQAVLVTQIKLASRLSMFSFDFCLSGIGYCIWEGETWMRERQIFVSSWRFYFIVAVVGHTRHDLSLEKKLSLTYYCTIYYQL